MDFLQKLLDHYHLDTEAYDHLRRPLSYEDLPHASSFPDLARIVTIIRKAIQDKQKIIVYGDYDADGVLATSILVDCFNKLGVKVGYYIPNRYQDGYGIHVGKVKEIAEKGYDLIITVDNGANANEAIEAAYASNMKVIITDHHEIQGELPRNEGILHPFLTPQPFPMSGAVMAFILARELLNQVNLYHLALAAMSTISDMMPLIGTNRDIVRLGLDAINKHQFLPITLLANTPIIDETTISMKIAPSINAIGRLIENIAINRLVTFFTTVDEIEARDLAIWIKSVNDARKQQMNDAYETLPEVAPDQRAIVYLSNEKEGLIGLLANRLANRYDIPCVVFTPDTSDPSLLVGSARTPQGYDLTLAFTALEPLLVRGGGHANAGGLTIEARRYDEFVQEFIEYFAAHDSVASSLKVIDIDVTMIRWDNYAILESFSPFGVGFKAPTFKVPGLVPANLSFIKNGKYLATQLSLDTKILSFVISREDIIMRPSLTLIGQMKKQTYRGKSELVFMASGFED